MPKTDCEFSGSVAEAMVKAKKLFLLNERRETWRIKLPDRPIGPCSECGTDVEWLTTHDAMPLVGLNELSVLKLIGIADVHSYEDDRGFLFFCKASLERFAARELDHEKD